MFEQWKQRDDPLFVLHDGPPYANGDLHMGMVHGYVLRRHMISYIYFQDTLLIKFSRTSSIDTMYY